LGLPNRRNEAWHYTDLRAALKSAAPLAPAPDAARLAQAKAQAERTPRLGAARLVLVDGHYIAALSDPLPAGVTAIAGAAPALEAPDAVAALNAAFAPAALRLTFAANSAPGVLEILHLAGPNAVYSRLDITVAGQASVLERFEGAGAATQRNAVASLDLAEGARCEWTTLVGDDAGLHLEAPLVRLAARAEFRNFALVCGGALVRRQLDVSHSGAGAKIALGGLSLIDGQRQADTTLTVRHDAPHGESREYFRHIVADEGVGTYQGKVIVAQVAQKTDGGMKSQALLLSPTAQMNNKPELEIFADDVVCGHGATVGALDAEQTFYLQARGIPRPQAEAMLLEAFGVEAIERVADEGVAEALREKLRLWLKGRAR
ncbi:MAG: SufD family Fe-S cluster assembly protein, partial [Pseudomonadota bacterium]|nr:SufD family Fe-S cluster assembly protein [Pseudomonadota bacterium]